MTHPKRVIIGVSLALLLLLLLGAGMGVFFFCSARWCPDFSLAKIWAATDFASCQQLRFPVEQTSPPRCIAGSSVFFASPDARLHVLAPLTDQEVALPLVVQGEARLGSGMTVRVLLRDQDGFALDEETLDLPEAQSGQLIAFSASLSYPRPFGTGGALVVSLVSPKGERAESATVPVLFLPAAAVEIKAFFGNTERDPGTQYCDVSYPVARRVSIAEDEVAAALRALIAGPNDQERAQKFFTSLPQGLAVTSFRMKDGTATITFNRALRDGIAGSCRVAAIRSQIERTLKQFAAVQEVVIRIEGVSDEEVLQP